MTFLFLCVIVALITIVMLIGNQVRGWWGALFIGLSLLLVVLFQLRFGNVFLEAARTIFLVSLIGIPVEWLWRRKRGKRGQDG